MDDFTNLTWKRQIADDRTCTYVYMIEVKHQKHRTSNEDKVLVQIFDSTFSAHVKDFVTVVGPMYIAQNLEVSDMMRESQMVEFLEPLRPKLWSCLLQPEFSSDCDSILKCLW